MLQKQNNHQLTTWFILLIGLTSLLLSGCQSTGKNTSLLKTAPMGHDQGLVSIFIQLSNDNGGEAWIKTSGVELINDQGAIMPLDGGKHELAAAQIGKGQRFLARGPVVAGAYKFLRIHLDKAALMRSGQKLFLSMEQPIIDLPLQNIFHLQAGESRTLIVTWDDQKSIAIQSRFDASMRVETPQFPLLANLAYVSCPDIDTLYLLSTDRNRISGSLAIKGEPSYMAYSPTRKRLYILSEKQATITVVETATNRIVDQFKIPMTTSPSFFMTPDGEWGYILDEKRGNIIRMNLKRGTMDQRVHLGYNPRYIAWHEAGQRLLVTSGLNQKVYFLNPETLQVQDTLMVGSNPDGLLVNDEYLYVAEQGANTVSIFDINTLRRMKGLSVGFNPRRLIAKNNNVYVSNFRNNSVSLILARQQRVARAIPVGQAPLAMTLSNQHKYLYVLAQHDGTISVLDQTSNKHISTVDLGTKPADILAVY